MIMAKSPSSLTFVVVTVHLLFVVILLRCMIVSSKARLVTSGDFLPF